MADYSKNIKRCNTLQNRIKRNEVMQQPTHERIICRRLYRSREHQVLTKDNCYLSDQIDSMTEYKGIVGNPFCVSPDKLLLINCQKTKDNKVKNAKQVPFIMASPRTICDIDKDFFKLVNGRPIRSYVDHKQYLRDITATTLERVNTAYIKDLILQFENLRHTYEGKEYQKAIELYKVIGEQFQQFLEDSWESVKVSNTKADAKYDELQTVLYSYDTYHYEVVSKKYEINNLCLILSKLDKYRKFLYKIAPIEWRLLYDDEFEGITYYFDNDEAFSTPSTASLQMVRKSLNATTDTPMKPRLYFTTPAQLIKVFEDIRAQSLNHIQMHALRSDITKRLIENKNYLTRLTSNQAEKWQEQINYLEKNIRDLKEKEVTFKTTFDIVLARNFYELYASYDSSKLLQCLQDANSAVINDPKVPSDSLFDLAQELETLYMELTSELDTLDPTIVKTVKNKVFTESLKLMKTAKLTRRQLRELDNLKKNLYVSIEPPRYKKTTDMKKTSLKSI